MQTHTLHPPHNTTPQHTEPHAYTLLYNTRHYTIPHYTTRHCTTPTTLHYSTLYYSIPHYTTIHCTTHIVLNRLHYTTLQYTHTIRRTRPYILLQHRYTSVHPHTSRAHIILHYHTTAYNKRVRHTSTYTLVHPHIRTSTLWYIHPTWWAQNVHRFTWLSTSMYTYIYRDTRSYSIVYSNVYVHTSGYPCLHVANKSGYMSLHDRTPAHPLIYSTSWYIHPTWWAQNTSCYMIVYINVHVHIHRDTCVYSSIHRDTCICSIVYINVYVHTSRYPCLHVANTSGHMSIHPRTPAHPHISYIVIHPSDLVGPKYSVLHRATWLSTALYPYIHRDTCV